MVDDYNQNKGQDYVWRELLNDIREAGEELKKESPDAQWNGLKAELQTIRDKQLASLGSYEDFRNMMRELELDKDLSELELRSLYDIEREYFQ